jgi:hypothetical protein
MPTGYTSRLCDGPQTFEEFVMGCARAFGAMIEMRDMDASAPIPEEFKPSDYHQKAIADARERLAKFKAMSELEAEKLAIAEYDEAVTTHHKRREDRRALRDRLGAMMRDVREWVPPTPDHQGMKEFMLGQLETTAEFDGRDWKIPEPDLVSGADYRLAGVKRALKDIAYHTVEHDKEVEWCRSRSAWVRALRESLRPKAAR